MSILFDFVFFEVSFWKKVTMNQDIYSFSFCFQEINLQFNCENKYNDSLLILFEGKMVIVST